jgi:hypothetical protein
MSCTSLVNLTNQVLYHPQAPTANCNIPQCCEQKSTEILTVDWNCNNDIVIDILAIKKSFKISGFDNGVITIANNNNLLSGSAFITCSCSNNGCLRVKALNKYELDAPNVIAEKSDCLSPAWIHFIHEFPPVLVVKDKVCKTTVILRGLKGESKLFIECDCCSIVGQSFSHLGYSYKITGQDADGNGCFVTIDTPLNTDINNIVKLSERQLILIGESNGCSFKFTIPRSFIEGWQQPLDFQIIYPGATSDSINGIIKCIENTNFKLTKPLNTCHACH